MSDPTPATVASSLRAHVDVTVYCRVCRHSGPLDLEAMAERGHTDTPLLALPLRCRCGARSFEVRVSAQQTGPWSFVR